MENKEHAQNRASKAWGGGWGWGGGGGGGGPLCVKPKVAWSCCTASALPSSFASRGVPIAGKKSQIKGLGGF